MLIGVDVGGTKITAGLVSPKGKILNRVKLSTEAKGGKETVIANAIKAIESVWPQGRGAKVQSIGVGIAGLVDFDKGKFIGGPNLPLENVPLAAILRKRFKCPVYLDNDVHCFTLAEAKFGVAKRFSVVVGMTLGTGIGGGIVIDGKLIRGRNNAAGEFGHTILNNCSQAMCSCGKTGHFEAFGSGSAMRKLYKEMAGNDQDAPGVQALAEKNDTLANKVITQMSQAIADGLANIIYTLNPDIIVVGGGIAHVDMLWKPVEKLLKDRLIFDKTIDTPIVRTHASDTIIIGAALITKKL